MPRAYHWLGQPDEALAGVPARDLEEEELEELASVRGLTLEQLRAYIEACPAFTTVRTTGMRLPKPAVSEEPKGVAP